ncbi:MAG: class E sortase [Syntrophomonadaceae bacterium]|jgi:sortase A|nr:class E sortase [Syntrophomonadaceae bacterium]
MNGGRRNFYLKILGSILVLGGLFLLAFPYAQSAYDQWAHPTAEVEPAEETPVPKEPTAATSPEDQSRDFLPISGRLVIPSLELDLEVGYGVEEEDLKEGPGFYPQSGYPSTGNVSIAGHRNAYGNPFWHLNELKPGDEIELYYDDEHYIYSVDEVYVTHSRDWSVVDPTSEPAITLTTCHPLHPVNGQYDRLIVRGYLQ